MTSSVLFDDEEVDSILEAQLQIQEEKTASKETLARLFGRLFQKLKIRVANFIVAIETTPTPESDKHFTMLVRIPELLFSDNCESDDEDPEGATGLQKKLSFRGFSVELVANPPPNTIYQTLEEREIQKLFIAEDSPVDHEVIINVGCIDQKISSVQVLCNFQTVKFGISPLQVGLLLEMATQLSKGSASDSKENGPTTKALSLVQPLSPGDRAMGALREVTVVNSTELMGESFFKQMIEYAISRFIASSYQGKG
jgi:hypothetical protein